MPSTLAVPFIAPALVFISPNTRNTGYECPYLQWGSERTAWALALLYAAVAWHGRVAKKERVKQGRCVEVPSGSLSVERMPEC